MADVAHGAQSELRQCLGLALRYHVRILPTPCPVTQNQTLKHSTDHVNRTPFRPHGSVQMWMEGDFLYYESTGPFNLELVESLAVAQMELLRATQYEGPWASICTVLNSAMASPEALDRYERLMRKEKPPGKEPVATAFVLGPDVEGAKLMAPRFTKIYQGIQRPFQCFERIEDARAWARAQMEPARLQAGEAG